MKPIITSILDSDLYKFTMGYAVAKRYPRAEVKYEFINRGKTPFPVGFADELKNQIEHMSQLRLTKDEHSFLTHKCGRFLDPAYLDFLKGYQFDPREVRVKQEGTDLAVKPAGYWYRTIYWEVPLMSTIAELYYKMVENPTFKKGKTKILNFLEIGAQAREKGEKLKDAGCKLMEFGTRRRVSLQVQRLVLKELKAEMGKNLVGTSNVMLAMENDLIPHGTQAHEWFMFHAAKYGYASANLMALGRWVDIFGGDLGIALTDTFTTEDFFRNFDLLYANQFRGVRHDSGDPFEFMEKVIKHYESLRIDPKSKIIVFSDGLDIDLCIKLQVAAGGRIPVIFGVGTHLTNDIGYVPMNMVIKLVWVLVKGVWVPTVKISDNKGKHLGPDEEMKVAYHTLRIPYE